MDILDLPSTLSPPSRGRGLKHGYEGDQPGDEDVAPFTGAWIETGKPLGQSVLADVAPFTGAWIETCAAIESLDR